MIPFNFNKITEALQEMAKVEEDANKIEEATNMFTDDITGFQIDRFAGKKGPSFQINYGRGKGKHIQIPKSDMKRVITQMTKAMNAKQRY